MKEKQSFFQSLSHETQQDFREWGEYTRLCNNPPTEPVRSIIIPTGGRMERAVAGLTYFRSLFGTQDELPSIVITGANGSQFMKSDTGKASHVARALRKFCKLTEEEERHVIIDDTAGHTERQGHIIDEMTRSGVIKPPIVLYVSLWHLARNYMTVVNKFAIREGNNIQTKVFAVPVTGPWDEASKDNPNQTRRERIASEAQRIRIYQEKGDVISRDGLIGYRGWLRGINSSI